MATVTYFKDGVSILEPTGKIIGELPQALIKHVDSTQTPLPPD